MAGYIGTQPVPQATQTRDSFTATASQTSFATSGYTPQFLDVYLNGVHLVDGTDYTATNGSDVVLASGATVNDVVEVVAFSLFEAVGSTATLTTPRNFSASGDATASAVAFDGSGDVDLSLTLATVNSNVGTVGSATTIPIITVDAKGRLTAVTTATVADTLDGQAGSYYRDASNLNAGKIPHDRFTVGAAGDRWGNMIVHTNASGVTDVGKYLDFSDSDGDATDFSLRLTSAKDKLTSSQPLYVGANKVLTTADEGSGNGLDADTLDGQEGTHYRIDVYNAAGTLLN